MFVARGLQTQPGECLLRLDVLPHKERVGRATGGRSHCELRLGLNDWRKKKKKPKNPTICVCCLKGVKRSLMREMCSEAVIWSEVKGLSSV